MVEPLHLYPLSSTARLSCYGYGHHFVSRPAGTVALAAPVKIRSRHGFLRLDLELSAQLALVNGLCEREKELGKNVLNQIGWLSRWSGRDLYQRLEAVLGRGGSAASSHLQALGLLGVCQPLMSLPNELVRPWRYTLFADPT